MGQEEDLEIYRSRLLESLSSRPRPVRGASDPIQVYVNECRVGELEGSGIGAMLQVRCIDHIETVQLRAEEGTLLGGLVAPEYGFRTHRVRLSADTIELSVLNTAQGGTLSALFSPAPSFWSRVWKSIVDVADRLAAHRPDTALAYGMRTVAFTQALLAIAVVGLVADRMTTWMAPEPAPSPVVQSEALPASRIVETARLEQQLDEVARMQEKLGETLGSQQKGMAQLQQAMAKLSSTQESVETSVQTVRQELEKQQTVMASREVERAVHQPSNKAQTRHGQIETAIHSLTVDNDRMSKEIAGLEQYNQDLKNKLLAAGLNPSKGGDSQEDRVLARQAEVMQPAQQPQVAQGAQNGQAQPFLFWVTFSDGTSQERIDQWVHEMKGHKGSLNEGWQEVQIVPPAVPPDRFLEQIKEDKIIKAARMGQ
ncbi:MAG: hypothetical protein P0120_16750 [Nitrospira sp.]|nr:hypothetical protein [Nitrospira sp.]